MGIEVCGCNVWVWDDVGYGGDGNVVVEDEGWECMGGGVEWEVISYGKEDWKGMEMKIDVFVVREWKKRVGVVGGIVEGKNVVGYGMEGEEEVEGCVVCLVGDEVGRVGVVSDMVRVEFV